MRDTAMSNGIGRKQSARRRLAKKRMPKKAVVAAVWPLGNELYFGLSRGPFHPSSCLTDGRARPVVIFSPRAAMPARAQRGSPLANAHQRLLPAPPGDCHEEQASQDVLRPVAVAADAAHELFLPCGWNARSPRPDCAVEMKRRRDGDDSEQDDEQPFPDRRDFMHREFAGCFSAPAIFESLSCNLQLGISRRSFVGACFFISPAPGRCPWSTVMSRVSQRPRGR